MDQKHITFNAQVHTANTLKQDISHGKKIN